MITYNVVHNALTPEFPESIPQRVRKLCFAAWAREPEHRPSFAALAEHVESLRRVRGFSRSSLSRSAVAGRQAAAPARSLVPPPAGVLRALITHAFNFRPSRMTSPSAAASRRSLAREWSSAA